MACYELTSEVTLFHFCSILLVTKVSPICVGEVYTGCECHKMRILGCHYYRFIHFNWIQPFYFWHIKLTLLPQTF